MLADHTFELAKFAHKAEQAAALMRALSNEKRLMVLCRLAAGERSVGELSAEIQLSQSALSQHLAKLRGQGLVKTRREAQTIYYSLDDPAAIEVIKTLVSIYYPELLP